MVVPVNEYAAGADNVFKGNVSPERRQELESITAMARSNLYGSWIGKRVVVTEVSIVPKVEEASQTEARVVCELTVDKGSFCQVRRSKVAYLIHARYAQPNGKLARCLRCVPDRQVRISFQLWVRDSQRKTSTAALHSFLSPQVAAMEPRRLWIAYSTPPHLC